MHYCRDCVSILALVDDNMSAQEAALRDRADILVATPARLVAHLKAGNVELKDTVSRPPRGKRVARVLSQAPTPSPHTRNPTYCTVYIMVCFLDAQRTGGYIYIYGSNYFICF